MIVGGWSYGPYGGFGGVGFLMMLVQILFWGGIFVLAFRFIRNHGMRQHISNFTENNNALDILRERFARGEIDSEEFQRRRSELQK